MKAVLLATGLTHTPDSLGTRPMARDGAMTLRPVIDLAIEAFVSAGFDEVGVILHGNQSLLHRYLEDGTRYGASVYTMHSDVGNRGRAASLQAARTFVSGEPFVLAMETSHLDPSGLQALTRYVWAPCAVLATRRSARLRTDRSRMRLRVDRLGRVEQAGDELRSWNALADDVFLFSPDVFRYIADLLQSPDGRCSLARLIDHMVRSGKSPQVCLSQRGRGTAARASSETPCAAPILSIQLSTEYLSA